MEKEEQVSGMRYYELSELSHSILNDVITAYARLILKEKSKTTPDQDYLREIYYNKTIALDILYNSDNFSSLKKMQEIIDKYSPMLKQLMQK